MDLETLKTYTQELNLLYVEDSSTLRKIIHKKIDPLFKHIDTAKDGEEALALYEHKRDFYDIVLTDLEMPKMDGKTLSQAILDFKFSQKIIVISSIEDFKQIIELINLGVYKFISKPVEDEQLYQVLGDVAMQKRVERLQEEELKEVEQHNAILQQRENRHIQQIKEFHKALDISALVSKTDINGTITYVNEKFCKVSGYTEEELLHHNHNIISSGNMDRHVFEAMWKKLLKKKHYRGLFENRDKKGKIFYVESFISPILDLNGEITEFISISHNMTKLVNSLNEITRIQKSKEYFFINLSHEMKTPLNAILGFSSILKNRLKDNQEALELIHTIHESGSELHHLIETTLDIGKLQDNSLALHTNVFKAKDFLKESLENFSLKAKKKRQTFNVHFDSALPSLLIGDEKRIIQLLSALFDNAIKFTQEEGEITIRLSYAQAKLHCLVEDNGIGIAVENQQKIFNFEQLDSHFDRSHEGAGLGLTLASGLIHLMKGEILLESRLNEGSRFDAIIPLEVGSV